MRKFNVGDFVVVNNKRSVYFNELGKVVNLFYEKRAKRTIYAIELEKGGPARAALRCTYLTAKDLILSLDRTIPKSEYYNSEPINQLIEKVQFYITETRVNLDAIEGLLDRFREDSDFDYE